MVLVVAGLVIGFLPFVPDVSLEPDVVLLGLLPLLVFDAAVTSSPTGFYRDAGSIGALAVLLVIVTAFGVAAVAHWLGHLSWPIAFVLGTAVGPTDAAAATAVARRIGLPRRLVTILEGEALFNDATALVLYAAAVTAATTGQFSVAHTAGSIVYAVVAGTASGWRWASSAGGCATGSTTLRSRSPARSCWPTSPISRPRRPMPPGCWPPSRPGFTWVGTAAAGRSRLGAGCVSNAFWETLVFLVNAALFVLVGLEFHTFRLEARGPLGRLVVTGLGVVLAVILVRLVWMWAFGWVGRGLPNVKHGCVSGSWRERLVLGWAGMRGAITLAALLAVPRTTRWRPPGRS